MWQFTHFGFWHNVYGDLWNRYNSHLLNSPLYIAMLTIYSCKVDDPSVFHVKNFLENCAVDVHSSTANHWYCCNMYLKSEKNVIKTFFGVVILTKWWIMYNLHKEIIIFITFVTCLPFICCFMMIVISKMCHITNREVEEEMRD